MINKNKPKIIINGIVRYLWDNKWGWYPVNINIKKY